jgi:ankyrin repeat protein
MTSKLTRCETSPTPGASDVPRWREAVGPLVLLGIGLGLVALRVMVEPNGADGLRSQALFDAAQSGNLAALQKAIDGGTSVNAAESGSGLTLLMWAARRNHADEVEWLLAHGADLEARSGYGTALGATLSVGDAADMVRLLLAHGADPNGCAQNGYTPLMCAATDGDAASAGMLIRAGARVDVRDRDGNTALALARELGHDEVVRLLLAAGADQRVAVAAR